MAIERIIGIDFGTSTSVIRVKRYEDGKPVGEKLETKEVIFSGLGATVPTLIQKKDDDESIVYYGYEAQQKRKKTTTYHSFKIDLESSDPEKRALARKLTEEFFYYLAKTYKAQSEGGHLGEPGDKERTIVSYPVKWGEETRLFMVEAAQRAGFPNVTGMDEAQAAIQAVTVMSEDHLRKNGLLVSGKPCNILLIDMGAGTTDLVLCRYTPGAEAKAEILSTWPKDGEILFGGREVDSLLQSFFRDMMDAESANLVFRRVGLDKFKTWKENTVSPALWKNDSVTDFEPLDNQIEDNDIDMDEYCLDRAAFEKCLESYLKQLPKLINGCIDNSKIKASDVDLVILTGGHSQWYFVKEMLVGKMPQYGKLELPKIIADPSRIIQFARPQETVARGLVYTPIQTSIPETSDLKSERKIRIPKFYLEDAVWKFFRDNPTYTCYDIPREMIQYILPLEYKDKFYYISVTDRFNRHGVNLGLFGRVVSQLYGRDGREFYMDFIDCFHNCVVIANSGIGIKFNDENNYVSYLDLINVKIACENGYLYMIRESGMVLCIRINEVDNSPNRFIHVITELQRHLIKAAEQFNRVNPEK